MPDRVQDLTNHRKVAVACKNYTDKEIKASEERILSIVARNNVDFIDHTDEATYRFTAPANAKLLMLQSIAGNSNKIAPSTPSDDSVARLKTIPDNTYKSQIDYIGGKSAKYNQLLPIKNTASANGITFTNNNDGSYTLNGTATADSYFYLNNIQNINGIKIFYGFTNLSTAIEGLRLLDANSGAGGTGTLNLASWDYNNFVADIRVANGTTLNNVKVIPIFINLTDIFGAGNEPSTVETAIPLLKANGYKLDGTDEYSTGKLKHAITTSVKFLPINVWDEEITPDYIYDSTTGQKKYFSGGFSCSANLQKVYPNTTYNVYIKDNQTQLVLGLTFYREDGTFIAYSNYASSFTTPVDCYFIGINMRGTTYANNICINISNASYNGNYYPYVAPITKQIPSAIQQLDGYGWGINNTCYNYIDFNSKKFVKKVGRVDLGILNFIDTGVVSSSGGKIYYYYSLTSKKNGESNILATKFTNTTDSATTMALNTIKGIPNGSYIYVCVSDISDITGYLYYELATPIETDISQYLTTDFKVDLDNQYATCEMVVDEPIDMPNKVEYYGTIIHALATAVKQEGFNKWDEEWQNGYINDTTGANAGDGITSYLRSKNYISVLPSQVIYFKLSSNGKVYYYDINQNYISYADLSNGNSKTIPTNCYFIRFWINYSGTYNHDICINISNQDLNGTYKPYKAPITRLLPNSEAKYSWGIADGVRNTRVFCDDECNPVNEGELDVDNVLLKDLNYSYVSSNPPRFQNESLTNIKKITDNNTIPNMILTKYEVVTWNNGAGSSSADKVICQLGGNYTTIAVIDRDFNNATTFKNHFFDDDELLYQKDATGTETLDDFDFSFDCEEGDTFTIIGCELLQCYATYSFLIKEAKSNE